MIESILIIDDEEDVRAIAQMGLEMAANWQVITAGSGKEGLQLAETKQPSLILLAYTSDLYGNFSSTTTTLPS